MLLSFPHPSPPNPNPFPSKPKPKPKPTLLALLTPNPNPNPDPHLPPLHASTSSSSSASPETLTKSAIRRISDKLRSLGYLEDTVSGNNSDASGAGEIFVPTPKEIPKYRVGSTLDPSWSTPESPVPASGAGPTMARFRELWRRERDAERRRAIREAKLAPAPPSAAELTLPPDELRWLRGLGIRIERRLKVGKAGVTEGIVNGIHERWRRSELVKIKCEDICRMNMKRTHEILERKTGGLVVWRSGGIVILYRGANYKYPYFHDREKGDENFDAASSEQSSSGEEDDNLAVVTSELSSSGEEEHVNLAVSSSEQHITEEKDENLDIQSLEQISSRVSNEQHAKLHLNTHVYPPSEPDARACTSLVAGVGSPNKFRLQLPGEVKLVEEADKLLDGLGPRFSDWWGYDPLPVDADLLPAIIPGFRKPFRLLPFGIKPKLTDREMTILRRLARPLPCHYALGRNRNLHGLAASMIKLWERCEVAKIAIKRGVQNTNSELMSEELKRLTGGTLLSRDEEVIVFYRGKDFLPPAVSVAIEERRKHGNSTINKSRLNNEESTPTRDSSELKLASDAFELELASDALVHGHEKLEKENSATEKRQKSVNLAVEKVEARLFQAIAKKERAEKLLEELEKTAEPSKVETDNEAISEEEMYMLRKVGLRMKPFLLLGRRGVFDGTIENMHLHWKYRELVKIICKERCIEDVEYAARILQAESGGILVAVERVSKGHAIIVYRGKNYQRPSTIRPKSLLNKRQALKRSLEAQRRESLKLHVLNLSKNIDKLRHQMYMEDQPVPQSTQMNSDHQNEPMHGVSINSPVFEENIEEVHEVTSEHLNSKDDNHTSGETDGTVNSEMDLTKFAVSLDNMQSRGQISSTSKCNSDDPNEDSQDGVTSSKPLPTLDEAKLDEKSDIEFLFKAAPLSNRERLVLRKQALKMRKRPVIAVGRNNVISGVAKTIKTHFKKHPLAIVNIKARAERTPVQQLIFELEEATGGVLVSREPNKVILYRGWGAGVAPKGSKKNDTDKREKELISPQLMEAIRLECGLHSGEAE